MSHPALNIDPVAVLAEAETLLHQPNGLRESLKRITQYVFYRDVGGPNIMTHSLKGSHVTGDRYVGFLLTQVRQMIDSMEDAQLFGCVGFWKESALSPHERYCLMLHRAAEFAKKNALHNYEAAATALKDWNHNMRVDIPALLKACEGDAP